MSTRFGRLADDAARLRAALDLPHDSHLQPVSRKIGLRSRKRHSPDVRNLDYLRLRTSADIYDDLRAGFQLRSGRRVGPYDKALGHIAVFLYRRAGHIVIRKHMVCGGEIVVSQIRHYQLVWAETYIYRYLRALLDRSSGRRLLIVDKPLGVLVVIVRLRDLKLEHLIVGVALEAVEALAHQLRDDDVLGLRQRIDQPEHRRDEQHRHHNERRHHAEQHREYRRELLFALRLLHRLVVSIGHPVEQPVPLFVLNKTSGALLRPALYAFNARLRLLRIAVIVEMYRRIPPELVEIAQHLRRRLVPLADVLLHGPHDDGFQSLGDGRVYLARTLRLQLDLLERDRHRRVRVERKLSGQHLVHHDANGIDVRPAVGDLSPRLLRAYIVHRTDGAVGEGGVVVARKPRDAEIGDLYRAVAQQHHILRLDVAVDYSLVMGVLECAQYLDKEVDRFLPFYHALLLDILLECDAVDVFHDDILHPVAEADIEHLDYIRMREHRDSL